jgi:hypothetical protein
LGETVQFSASVTNTSNTAVTWSTAYGSVSSTGLYTPALGAPNGFSGTYVTATSVVDTTKSGSATVTINPPDPPSVSGTLPGSSFIGADFLTYSVTASVTGTIQAIDFWVPGGGQSDPNSDYGCRVEYDPSSNLILVGTTDGNGNDIWGSSAAPGTANALYSGYGCQVNIAASSVTLGSNGTITLQLSIDYLGLGSVPFYASALDYSQLTSGATYLGAIHFYEGN